MTSIYFENGRQPRLFLKWMTLIYFENGRRPQFILEMEADLNLFLKWKKTSIYFENGKRP